MPVYRQYRQTAVDADVSFCVGMGWPGTGETAHFAWSRKTASDLRWRSPSGGKVMPALGGQNWQ
jgi:hypothetical protein